MREGGEWGEGGVSTCVQSIAYNIIWVSDIDYSECNYKHTQQAETIKQIYTVTINKLKIDICYINQQDKLPSNEK